MKHILDGFIKRIRLHYDFHAEFDSQMDLDEAEKLYEILKKTMESCGEECITWEELIKTPL